MSGFESKLVIKSNGVIHHVIDDENGFLLAKFNEANTFRHDTILDRKSSRSKYGRHDRQGLARHLNSIGKGSLESAFEADPALKRLDAEKMKKHHFLGPLIYQQALKSRSDTACGFSRLPVDICRIIFAMCAEGSEMKTANLMLVCRYWEAIVLETPALCRRLSLTMDTPQKLIKSWISTVKMNDCMLRIHGPFTIGGRRPVFKDLQWDRVRSLTFVMSADRRLRLPLIPYDISAKIKPEELCFCGDSSQETEKPEQPTLRALVAELDTSRLRALLIKWPGITHSSSLLKKLPNLTILRMEYDGLPPLKEFLGFLNSMTSLEELTLKGELVDSFGPLEKPVLENLKMLYLKGWDTCFVFRQACLPNVESVTLVGASEVSSTMRKGFMKLKSLRLDNCAFKHAEVLKVLKKAERLETLHVENSNSASDGVNAIIEAIGKPVQTPVLNRNVTPGSGSKNESSSIYVCPKLQHLYLHNIKDLAPSEVRQLLGNRLKDEDSESEVKVPIACLPLHTLDIKNK